MGWNMPAKTTGFAQGIKEVSSTQKETLGQIRWTADGRGFMYSENGGVALAPGKLIQSEVPAANHKDIACNTHAIGDTAIYVTLGATAAALNDYKEGYLHVNDDTGEGHIYKVQSNPAIDSSGSGYIYLEEPIEIAFAANTTVTLTKHKCKDTIIMPSPNTACLLGVPLVVVPISYYFWVQFWGVAPVLTDGTLVIGQHARVSDNIDGAAEPLDRDGTAEDELSIGQVVSVNADTEYSLIDLRIG